jgi:hypothetical protein|nr:MAG TPA: hypothetical protein [Caudoviricetes sp.]
MINVNDDFKIDIRTHGRQFDVQLKANNIDIDNDNLNYLKPAFNTTLFKTVMHQIEIDSKLYMPADTKITGKIGVKVNKKTYNYIDLNTYYVKSCERQEDTNSYRILAYTKMQEAMVDNELELTAKLTVRNYLLAVCQKLNWNTDNIPESFINSNKLIDPTLHIGIKYTYRDILDEITTITCSFLLFKGENLYLIYPTETNQNIDESYLDEDNITIGEKYIINSLVFSRAEESDNIFRKDDTSIATNGLHEYRISDCQLLSTNDRSDYIDEMFNYLKTLSFYIFDVQSKGILFLEACDIFNFVLNEVTYKTILLNNEIELDDGLAEKLYTDEPEETETEYKYADSTDKRINKAYILVDKQNKRITQLTKETTENTQKITKVEQDVNGITSKVSSVEQSVENITKIEGTAEGKNIYIDDASAEPLIDIMLEGESQQATRSGKNLLDNTATTKISNGITFTVNSDKTVNVNGTNDTSANSSLIINRYDLSPGTYILNGCPSGGASNTYRLAIQETGSYSVLGSIDIGNGSGEFTIDTTTSVQIAIFIQKGLTINNLLFKPMLREATIADDTYEQYGASPSTDYLSEIENLEGENICPSLNTTRTINGVTFTKNKDGSITMNGTATAEITYPINVNTTTNTRTVLLKANSKYRMLSSYESGKYTTQVFYLKNNITTYSSSLIETVEETKAGMYIRVYKNAVLENVTIYPQITKGEEDKPYVPYNSLEIKDVRENLLDVTAKTTTAQGLTFTVNENKSITINGTNTSTKTYYFRIANNFVLPAGDYTLSNKNANASVNGFLFYDDGNIFPKTNISNATFAEDTTIKPYIRIVAGVTINNQTIYPMIIKGTYTEETIPVYKPYQEQTEYFPLSEGQKLYKNSYLANDGIHHVRKQYTFTGNEEIVLSNRQYENCASFYFNNQNLINKQNNYITKEMCSHFAYDSLAYNENRDVECITDNTGIPHRLIIFQILKTRLTSIDTTGFKAYLSEQYANGTPVIVEYELAEEEIVPYTEEQKAAWEKLRHFTLFKGINNITSTANAKITYVRDNGLSDTYETKRNVKENHYTKSETDSQISQTADSIKESVKEINEQTQEKLATLELANQSLEFATKRVGGNNLIRNSAMINDNNFWLAHAKYPYQESDTPPDSPTEGAYWYCTANSGSYIENQMYVYNSGWQVSELSRKSLLSAQNYFAYTTSNEYWANGKSANENTLSGRVIKLDGRQDYTVSHIFNITEPITLNQNENKMAISHFIKNSIVQGNVCVGLMFLNEADFTEVEKPYSLYEPGIILTPDDLKDLTKIEQIIEIPKKSDFIPVVVSNTAPTDTTKNWLDATIYLPKKYNSQTSQWEILDTKMSLYNESSREVWTYRYFYGFYYQTPIIYDTAEIKSCYVALTFYPAFAVYTGNVEPTPYKGLYWNNKTTNLVKRAKYNDTTFVEWETLDIPSSLLPTGASLGVELFDYIVPIKGFVEIADLKLEYNTMCTQWTQFPGEVYGKNYKMDEKGFWIQANQNTMFIDEDEILATYKGINIFQINKDLAYFYKIQATESIEVGNYFLKTQQINSKNMLLLY